MATLTLSDIEVKVIKEETEILTKEEKFAEAHSTSTSKVLAFRKKLLDNKKKE